MSTTAAEVVTPVATDADELAKVLSLIEAHETRPGTSPTPAFFSAAQVSTIVSSLPSSFTPSSSVSSRR